MISDRHKRMEFKATHTSYKIIPFEGLKQPRIKGILPLIEENTRTIRSALDQLLLLLRLITLSSKSRNARCIRDSTG